MRRLRQVLGVSITCMLPIAFAGSIPGTSSRVFASSVDLALSARDSGGAQSNWTSGESSIDRGGDDILCTLGPGRSLLDSPDLDFAQMRHCTCPESVGFFMNSDRLYEAALMWNGTALAAPYGAFAERYETPNDQAGAICQVTIHVTDNGNGVRSHVDLYVWEDANGRPGRVAGVIEGIDLGRVPVWPRYVTRELEVYEIKRIGVQGPFWVGIRGAWESDSCSVYIPIDLEGDHPETVRAGMTYVAPGTPFPEGWQTIESIYGQPAALGIGVIVGWCPVPEEQWSWGRVKALYRATSALPQRE